jgi:cobaltochelatase CobN
MSGHQRARVVRADGKPINLVRRRGHLLVCAKGCCCGHTERGHAAVPVDFFKGEYKRRKIRNHVQLTMNGCLGPCPLANVVLLFFDGRPIWLQSINTEAQVAAIYDYIERLLASETFLPPPSELAEYVFDFYTWSNAPESSQRVQASARPNVVPGILFLSHADTDLLTLHNAQAQLPEGFPPVRGLSLNRITTSEHMEAMLVEHGLSQIVLARLLGGMQRTPGFARLITACRASEVQLLAVSGTGSPDPELAASSSVSPAVLHEVTAYLQAGGVANTLHMLRFLADHLLLAGFGHAAPEEEPLHGIYHPDLPRSATLRDWLAHRDPARPTAGLLFYRSHWMSGNLAFVDIFVRCLEENGLNALPVFTTSLRDISDFRHGHWPAAFAYFFENEQRLIDVLISTVSFAMGESESPSLAAPDVAVPLNELHVPVLQVICCGTARWQWQASPRGLNPLDTAMNVALPEFDGRIITVPISFKESVAADVNHNSRLDAIHYVPDAERMTRVARLAARFARLRKTDNARKRIAFILTNSSGKAARIGNAVGLDAPASLIRLLEAMRDRGYHVENMPPDGDALIHDLINRCSYDETFLTPDQLALAPGRIAAGDYQRWFEELPEQQRQQMAAQWGPPPGEAYVHDGHIALAGLELGNVFVALQPPRGYGMDPNAIYHQPDLPPTHHYHALYRWLRDVWQADAIVHLGKHGTLEWLPGKSVGMSADCFPDSFLGDLPLFYPFILNDPGEGAQAKRRSHAVIVDHLTPPMTTAGTYGELAQLMQLVDEYYQVELLDPAKLPLLQRQIWDLIKQAHLQEDLKFLMQQNHGDHVHEWEEALTADGTPVTLAQMQGRDVSHLVQELDGYLCELAGAQIRDGLHILGQVPEGERMTGLLQALTRLPNLEAASLRLGVARLFGLDLEAIQARLPEKFSEVFEGLDVSHFARVAGRAVVTCSDALEIIDEFCQHLLAWMQHHGFAEEAIDSVVRQTFAGMPVSDCKSGDLRATLAYVCRRLYPALQQTTNEIGHLLAGLEGGFVPAGPSGAPTRGMAHVLPTGRNFYTVDPRGLPSPTAWQVGQELAREVLDRFQSENGAYPETVGISVWGTSAMRTRGDDVAEIFALLGVRPIWQKESRRVQAIEAIPLAELHRPRIDVVIRISGFFRDAFPHIIRLFDEAVQLVAALDEPVEQNFVRKHFLEDLHASPCEGDDSEVEEQALYRIFGSKPGAYGAGLLPLIDERDWHDDADLAATYVNWGGYAYTAKEQGIDARAIFRRRLSGVQVAVHNQDNREHDIFDSDDYFQFHGGMIATIRSLTGKNPCRYFGDTQDPARPAVRDLKEEVLRVFRTRVVNPKWLESIMRHGYKGGLELAATVDYLFGYDATANVAEDWMYEQVAQQYALNSDIKEFLERSNPWALHAVAERLLEAAQRGLWKRPGQQTLENVRQAILHSDAILEARS